MREKNTTELENILGRTHLTEFESYCQQNKDSMFEDKESFYVYIRDILAKKHMTQQRVFLNADIPERYGYKLLSGEKHTKQRDVILRICYAGELTLSQTQRALKKYGMPELYAKVPRDALLMIMFNERPGDIIEVTALLRKKGMEPLRTSGIQE